MHDVHLKLSRDFRTVPVLFLNYFIVTVIASRNSLRKLPRVEYLNSASIFTVSVKLSRKWSWELMEVLNLS